MENRRALWQGSGTLEIIGRRPGKQSELRPALLCRLSGCRLVQGFPLCLSEDGSSLYVGSLFRLSLLFPLLGGGG